MFQNKNGKIINQLANSSIKADKKRNFFIILTIAFATALMLILALTNLGRSRENRIFLQGRYQAAFIQLNDTTINSMKQNKAVEAIGRKADLLTKHIADYTLFVTFKDNTVLNLLSASRLIGRMPEEKYEIIVEKSYLEHLGLSNNLAQQIKLDLGDGIEKIYTVCGILQDDNEGRTYQIIPSVEYVSSVNNDKPLYDALIRFRNSDKVSTEELKVEIQNFAKEFGISEKDYVLSSTFFGLAKENSLSEILAIIAASIMIVIASSLVIYSLFYISVIGKTQAYGRYRVIGTTKKQIKKIVRKEGLTLASIAIPLGLAIGCIIGYLLVPKGWHWPTALISMLLITLVSEITIYISTHTPIKIAASVSPIEAVHITPYTGTVKAEKSKKLHRSISPASLALINFSRNRKKTIVTLLSLGFTGVLLMCSSAYLNSIDTAEMAKRQLPHGEFNITLNPGSKNDSMIENYTKLQGQNPLSKELESALLAIDGVKRINKYIGCESEFVYPNSEKSQNRVIGLTKQQLKEYSQCLLKGTVDYNELVNNRGILISDPEGLISKFYNYTAKLGDKILISTDKGTAEEFKIMGIMGEMNTGIDMDFYFIPNELIPSLKYTVSNYNTHFFIQTDTKKLVSIEKQIFTLTSSIPDLEITTMKDLKSSLQQRLEKLRMPLYGLIAFISIFGIINLINTLMTNLISRQQELGILQSIGLSNRQLYKMLKSECLFYILGTLFITLTVGTGCGILLCRIFDQFDVFGKISYHFPVLELIIYFMVLLVIQYIFTHIAMRICKKKSLVDRIKIAE